MWRMSDPSLSLEKRAELVSQLMAARSAVGIARRHGDTTAEDDAHRAVDKAKRALGERGPVWWDDGAPDFNRHMARATPYADWFGTLSNE